MSFEMQVKKYYTGAQTLKARVSWESLRATIGFSGQPYLWDERHRAERMLEICYPHIPSDRKRVIEVDKPANIGHETHSIYGSLPLYGWERKKLKENKGKKLHSPIPRI